MRAHTDTHAHTRTQYHILYEYVHYTCGMTRQRRPQFRSRSLILPASRTPGSPHTRIIFVPDNSSIIIHHVVVRTFGFYSFVLPAHLPGLRRPSAGPIQGDVGTTSGVYDKTHVTRPPSRSHTIAVYSAVDECRWSVRL